MKCPVYQPSEEKDEQERNDFISCRQKYVDRLSELMTGVS